MNIFTIMVVAGVFAVTFLVIWVINKRSENQQRLSITERSELRSARKTIDSIDSLAFEHRELDSMLAPMVIDEIRKHKRRELQ